MGEVFSEEQCLFLSDSIDGTLFVDILVVVLVKTALAAHLEQILKAILNIYTFSARYS